MCDLRKYYFMKNDTNYAVVIYNRCCADTVIYVIMVAKYFIRKSCLRDYSVRIRWRSIRNPIMEHGIYKESLGEDGGGICIVE
jgi:hypothetical protein